MPFAIDTRSPPFVRVVASHTITIEDADAFCDAVVADYGLREPYVCVMVEGENVAVGFRVRHHIAHRLVDHAKRIDTLERGTAIVTASSLVRGISQAVIWTISPARPVKFFADETAARAWGMTRLQVAA